MLPEPEPRLPFGRHHRHDVRQVLLPPPAAFLDHHQPEAFGLT